MATTTAAPIITCQQSRSAGQHSIRTANGGSCCTPSAGLLPHSPPRRYGGDRGPPVLPVVLPPLSPPDSSILSVRSFPTTPLPDTPALPTRHPAPPPPPPSASVHSRFYFSFGYHPPLGRLTFTNIHIDAWTDRRVLALFRTTSSWSSGGS